MPLPIIVTEANPIIDVQSVRQSETIDREIFEVLPTTRGYDSLALLIPAMNVQGGATTRSPSTPAASVAAPTTG